MNVWLIINSCGQGIIKAEDIDDIYAGRYEVVCGFCDSDPIAIIKLESDVTDHIRFIG